MAIGQNILELRKKNGLSQEGLGETAPNPDQLKLLSKALNISVDDLIDNDLQNVVLSKVKITEKQIKTIKKTLKGFFIGSITLLIIDIIAFIICFIGKIGPFEQIKSENGILYTIKEII